MSGPVAVDDLGPGTLSIGGVVLASGYVFSNDTGTGLRVRGFRAGPEAGSGSFSDYVLAPPGGIEPTDVKSVTGTFGTLTLTRAGTWQYVLDQTDPDTLALAGGQHATEIFTYRAEDIGGLTDLAQLSIDILGVNAPPAITSNGGGASARIVMFEGNKAVTELAANDPDGNLLTYSISGGADAGQFRIDAATGALAFKSAPDFGKPKDAGHNNIYNVTVSVSDGAASDTQQLRVFIKDVGATVIGTASSDIVVPGPFGRATAKADRIEGGDGWDWLSGGGGNDTIRGGDGNDLLKGGSGHDWLRGGGGRDAFVFNDAEHASSSDRIVDFRSGADVIILEHCAFDQLWWGRLPEGAFYAHAGASRGHDTGDRIVYDTKSGNLYYDEDGSGGANAVQIATLAGHPALTAGDFLII